MYNIILSLLEVLAILVPVLIAVAFITILERKMLASIQRRVGPNSVGVLGVLQPFSDALKLIARESVLPSLTTPTLFLLAPIITLVFSLIGWAVIPFGSGLSISDYNLGLLYTLAISSIGIYGVLLAGWAANSKYAFLGSLRSTAQIVSYELIFSSLVLTIVLLSGSFNLGVIGESQSSVWYLIPLFPLFLVYFLTILAETNRTPFDLVEAESELVSGFMTEHSSVPFVFFFLGEYSSIVLISSLTAILFLGGYTIMEFIPNNTIFSVQSLILGIKTCFITIGFVHARATLPRLKYDQLITLCWTQILPVVIAILLLVPSLIIAFDMVSINIT